MKLSIVFFAAVILYVSAGPLAEIPSVRGPSQGCKDKWTQTVMGLSSVTASAKLKLSVVAVMQMLQMSYWFSSSCAQLQLNIDAAVVLSNSLVVQMGMTFPANQIPFITGSFQTAISAITYSVNSVKAVSVSQGQAMQAQLTCIQTNVTTILSQLQTCASSASIFSTIMASVSDTVLTQLTVTVQAMAQIQSDCAIAYAAANSQSNIAALMMDIVMATTSPTKQIATTVVNAAVSATCTATQTAVQSVTTVQVAAMQATSTVVQVQMTSVSETMVVVYATLCTSLMVQHEFDFNVMVSASAELEAGNTAVTTETATNITQTNSEFTLMCSNTTEADNITATANSYTAQITVILQSQSSLSVQMCANIAISAIIVEQTKGQNGIGQCVSDGKQQNDADMQDIQQNFTACAQENQQNLTNCANKYKDPNYSGKSAANTDTGENKSQMVESCKNVSLNYICNICII